MLWALKIAFGGLSWLRKAGRAAIEWASGHPAWALCLILAVLGAIQTHRVARYQSAYDRAVEAANRAEREHKIDIERIVAAQDEAERVQRDNLARVAKEQEQINEREIASYRADAASWHTRFERLRKDGNRGASGSASLPAVSETSGRSEAPDHDPGDAADSQMIAVRIDDLEALVENSVRGEAIRRAWLANEEVGTSPE